MRISYLKSITTLVYRLDQAVCFKHIESLRGTFTNYRSKTVELCERSLLRITQRYTNKGQNISRLFVREGVELLIELFERTNIGINAPPTSILFQCATEAACRKEEQRKR